MNDARQHSFPSWPWMLSLCLGLAFLLYGHGLGAGYFLDDFSSVENNPSLRHLWPPQLARHGGTVGRPLANYSFALTHALGKGDPAVHRALNVALLGASACLLFSLLRLASLAILSPEPCPSPRRRWFPALGALLWLLHPIQTSSAMYIAQRTELLCGFLGLLSCVCLLRSNLAAPSRRWMWLGACLISGLAAVGSKELAVMLPFLWLLLDAALRVDSPLNLLRTRALFYVASLSLPALGLWLFHGHGGASQGVGFETGVSPLSYLGTEVFVWFRYLALLLFPSTLVMDRGSTLSEHSALLWIPLLMLCAGSLGLLLHQTRKQPWLWILFLAPLLLLAPTSTIIPLSYQPCAESRLLLPSAAFCALLALLLLRLPGRFALLAALACLSAYGLRTWVRVADFRTPLLIHQQNLAWDPRNARAWLNYGLAISGDATMQKAALVALAKAHELKPQDPGIAYNFALVLARSGRLQQAYAVASPFRELAPAYPPLRDLLSMLEADLKR